MHAADLYYRETGRRLPYSRSWSFDRWRRAELVLTLHVVLLALLLVDVARAGWRVYTVDLPPAAGPLFAVIARRAHARVRIIAMLVAAAALLVPSVTL